MQVFIKNTRLYFKGFLGFLCFGNPCWRAQLYLSEERLDHGTWRDGYTYTLQMVSFYESWNCVWWNWLNIKRAPSAICSNRKWFGQMLTSFEMTDSALTREDAQRCPALRWDLFPGADASAHTWIWTKWVILQQHFSSEQPGISKRTAFFHSHLPSLLTLISLEERSTHSLLSTKSLHTPALWQLEESLLILVLKSFQRLVRMWLPGIELFFLSGL